MAFKKKINIEAGIVMVDHELGLKINGKLFRLTDDFKKSLYGLLVNILHLDPVDEIDLHTIDKNIKKLINIIMVCVF